MAAKQTVRKLNRLKQQLLGYKKVLVAYSGGVDSTFLLRCAHDWLGEGVLAVTAVSETYTKKELQFALNAAKKLSVRHKIIRTRELDNPDFSANHQNRCYYCKKELFGKLKKIAEKERIDFILDGSNADDLKDYRPGAKAKEESGVCSPLVQAGLNKKEIRQLSKKFGLETWDHPNQACLASRFSYGQKINKKDLARIEKGEDYIRALGIKMARLRHYRLPGSLLLARIEVGEQEIRKVTNHKSGVISYLKKLGYNYVTLDLEGYRTGSMNEGLEK